VAANATPPKLQSGDPGRCRAPAARPHREELRRRQPAIATQQSLYIAVDRFTTPIAILVRP
jgi:hypothetical protein